MHAESTLRQAGINSPHRYRQNAMMLLSKTLHHNWLSTSRSSWDEKHKQCPALFEQFRPVFNTPGTLMIPMAFQELFQHYGWNDDDTVAFMTAAYCHVAELDYAGKMGKLQRDGTMPRSTFKGLTFSQDTPFHSNQDAASLCFELMCMGHTDFQYLLFDADRTERGWYAEMLDIIWSRHPTLAQTLRPIVELGCPYNERGEPTPCPMEVYALARASQPKVDVPQWALPELHA